MVRVIGVKLGSWRNWLAQKSYTLKVRGSSPLLPTNYLNKDKYKIKEFYRRCCCEISTSVLCLDDGIGRHAALKMLLPFGSEGSIPFPGTDP